MSLDFYTHREGVVAETVNRGESLSIVSFVIPPGQPYEEARVHFGKRLEGSELADILNCWISIEKVIYGEGENRIVQQRLSNRMLDIVTDPMPYGTFRRLITQSRKAS